MANAKIPIIILVIFFFGALALGDSVANLVSLTLGYGFNNNGSTITTTGNLSINQTVIQSRLTNCTAGFAAQTFSDTGTTSCVNITSSTTGVNTTTTAVCAVNLIALTSKTQNYTYANGLLISNSSCS